LTAAAAERRIRPNAMTEAFIRADVLGDFRRERARARKIASCTATQNTLAGTGHDQECVLL
jgi:hypothetical protein